MSDAPLPPSGFVPGRHQIESYGRGGFRFAGMSHRGSLLILPSGVRAWPVGDARDVTLASLEPVLAPGENVDFLVVGIGRDLRRLPDAIRTRFREAGIQVDAMQTGPAARTYNVLVAEDRRVAAALIAVE